LQRPQQQAPPLDRETGEFRGDVALLAGDPLDPLDQPQHDQAMPPDRVGLDGRIGRCQRVDVERERARVEPPPRLGDRTLRLAASGDQMARVARSGTLGRADLVIQLGKDVVRIAQAQRVQGGERPGLGAGTVLPHDLEVRRAHGYGRLPGEQRRDPEDGEHRQRITSARGHAHVSVASPPRPVGSRRRVLSFVQPPGVSDAVAPD
jgi:hypothetical protein